MEHSLRFNFKAKHTLKKIRVCIFLKKKCSFDANSEVLYILSSPNATRGGCYCNLMPLLYSLFIYICERLNVG